MFCRPLWSLLVSITPSTLDFLDKRCVHTAFQNFFKHYFYSKHAASLNPEVMLCTKDSRQKCAVHY